MQIIILNIFFSLFYSLNVPAESNPRWKLNDYKDESNEFTSNPYIITSDHAIFDKLLGKYVSVSGKVNYKGLKSDKALLDLYLSELQNGPGSKASKNERLAFWINAYNAFTLKMIIDNYPVKSITTLYKGKPWDHSWIVIDRKTYSLNDIEHKIIRPQFKEPRIHFAVNCASVSCPKLANKAYTASNLESMLEAATKSFINSKENNITSSAMNLSPLFDWYKDDFGDIRNFIAKYSKIKPSATAPISYLKYNWNLNE